MEDLCQTPAHLALESMQQMLTPPRPWRGLRAHAVDIFFLMLFSDLLSVCLFSQGSDGARRSALLDSDEPLVYFYDDVRTLYEGFQRGIQVSSKHQPESVQLALQVFPFDRGVFLQEAVFAHNSLRHSLAPSSLSPPVNFCRASPPAHRSHRVWPMVKAFLQSHAECFTESHTSVSSVQALTFPA